MGKSQHHESHNSLSGSHQLSGNLQMPTCPSMTPDDRFIDTQAVNNAPTQMPCAPSKGNSQAQNESNTSLRFFVVDHPTKLKDKKQMRENRKHVMHDYLDKERRKCVSHDIRITGTTTAAKKRKRAVSLPPTSVDPYTSTETSSQALTSTIKEHTSARYSDRNLKFITSDSRTTKPKINSHPIRFADDRAPLVRGISGGFNNSRYLRASPESIPALSTAGPTSFVGSNLQPFDTWPALADPALNVEELKWSCSRKFGSHGIAKSWVPTLLKARHAFLSTICISASHDDIMKRALQSPRERTPLGSEERMKVRSEVLTLINQALQDPQMQTADVTLVAVLHVLNSEIMGCDDSVMRIHQDGLHNLVRQRGGLDNLGIDGHLASILTITMYMISALRENEPHRDFIKYGAQKRTKPPNNQNQLPESPVYSRPTGYLTVKRAISESGPTFLLLEDLRQLTHAFVRGAGSHFVTPLTPLNMRVFWDQHRGSPTAWKDQISALPPCEDIANSFDNMSDKYTYESLRLVALVYAHALANEVPFSKAAAQLATASPRVRTSPLPIYPLSNGVTSKQQAGMSWHLVIKSALIRTDLSDCWSHMAGVLFWMALVAGACANPDSPSKKPRRELSDEDEEGRKWLAAIAVRCSIVLSFEYGGAILETLKRVVGIEQALAGADAERGALEEWFSREDVVYGPTLKRDAGLSAVFGPAEESFVQRTFADFARDFMSDLDVV